MLEHVGACEQTQFSSGKQEKITREIEIQMVSNMLGIRPS